METVPTDPPAALAGQRPIAELPIGHLVRISLYWLGLTAIDGAVGLFIQNRLNYGGFAGSFDIGRTAFLISIPVAVLSILIQPTVGAISDYTVSRWGRRKPYIVFGSLLDLVFLAGIATSNNVLILGAFVALLTVSTNIARGPFQGYVPDLIAERQVGMASALVGLMQILGNVTGFLLVTIGVAIGRIELAIAAVAIVELVTMVAVVLRVSPGLAPRDRAGRSWVDIAKTAWGTDILQERSYVWLVASRFFFLMGGGILVNFVIAYLKTTHGQLEQEANGTNFVILIIVVLANLIAIIPSARISDRIGRKPVIYASCVVGSVGLVIAALGPSVPFALIGRLGVDHRHHPARVLRSIHGPLERRDQLVDGVRRHDRWPADRLREQLARPWVRATSRLPPWSRLLHRRGVPAPAGRRARSTVGDSRGVSGGGLSPAATG